VSYTAPAPPVAESTPSTSTVTEPPEAEKSPLQPLPEESETEGPTIVSPVPKAPPATFLNGDGGYESPEESLHLGSVPDGEVMKATMTDVQKAIEQLGRGATTGEDGDGARSFSFASTRDGHDTETDTDFDFSDVEAPLDANGQDWHKNARRKLADKARMALESAQKLEEMMSGKDLRRPPIDVELSDESDAEEDADFTRVSKFQRDHPHILEEDENEEVEARSNKDTPPAELQHTATFGDQVLLPVKDETDVPTATKSTFPAFSPPPPAVELEPEPEPVSEQRSSSPEKSSYVTPATPASSTAIVPAPTPETKRSSVPVQGTPVANGLPSPSPSSSHFNKTLHSKHTSIVSTTSAPAATTPAPQVIQTPPQPPALATSPSQLKKTHPTEWSLDEVVEWLKSKGFDQDVCDKFIGNFSLFLAPYVEPYFFLQNKKSQAMYCSNSMSTSSNPKSVSWHLENVCASPMLLPTFVAPLPSSTRTIKTYPNNLHPCSCNTQIHIREPRASVRATIRSLEPPPRQAKGTGIRRVFRARWEAQLLGSMVLQGLRLGISLARCRPLRRQPRKVW